MIERGLFPAPWNQFWVPRVIVQRDDLRPVSLGTRFVFGRFTTDRGMIAAGVTISMLPVMIHYLILQRRFIEGITAGALNVGRQRSAREDELVR